MNGQEKELRFCNFVNYVSVLVDREDLKIIIFVLCCVCVCVCVCVLGL